MLESDWDVKIGCQIMKICYNMSVATFWQQKISKYKRQVLDKRGI